MKLAKSAKWLNQLTTTVCEVFFYKKYPEYLHGIFNERHVRYTHFSYQPTIRNYLITNTNATSVDELKTVTGM